MKKLRTVLLVVLSVLMLSSVLAIGAGASSAYQTYTYSISGKALYSPDAYTAIDSLDYLDIGMPSDFKNPKDMVTSKYDEKVYIADTGNNRIVVLSRYYKYLFSISTFINSDTGVEDSLESPQGVFVTEDSIWVCDTEKSRLVQFDLEGNFVRIISAPESQLFDEGNIYKPSAMAIDQYGRIYVVSYTTFQGIIVMDSEGAFVGFIGAQAVTVSAWEILWKRFQTEDQKKESTSYVSTAYNNIDINEEGFIYATITPSDSEIGSFRSAIKGKSKSGKYMPVKLLNPAGDEIMRRNGFWPPAGEVDFSNLNSGAQGISAVKDVAVGPEKTWSIIDADRKKIFTYDFNGNLLFAFGDNDYMLGSISSIDALCYQGDTMLVLDKGNSCIIVYERTGYGDMLIEAIAAENSLNYDYAIECWEKVLQRNTNFDAAYVGIGNALYRSGDYAQSLAYYEAAYDTSNWSESYKQVRKDWMSEDKGFLLVVLVIVVAVVLVIKFFGFAGKVNKRVATDGKVRKTFGQELLYGFYIIFHPFDGFYDLKHENRGSVRASLVFIAVTIVAFFYQGIGEGYVLNPTHKTTTIWSQAISVLVPLILFVLANWCLTTLFEGEGSFKNIFIASSYALLPLPLLIIPATVCSNWVTNTEAAIITFVSSIALVWVGLLLFFGTMVTHDYPLIKNLITLLGTIVAMACIVFIVLLFSMLLSKLVGLVANIVTEIQYRM